MSQTLIAHVNIQDPDVACQLHALQLAAYRVESELIGYPQLPPLLETIEDLQRADEQFLVFKAEGQILGAVAYVRANDTLEICRLFVSPEHFRCGIAGKLLGAVEETEADINHLIVSTAEKNAPATILYQKHGYHLARRTVLLDGLVLVHLHKQIRSEQA